MLTPQMNPDGYEQSAVNNMTGFNNAEYLLAHGTGDDNGNEQRYVIHVKYIAALINLLTHLYKYSSFSTFCSIS